MPVPQRMDLLAWSHASRVTDKHAGIGLTATNGALSSSK